LKYILGISAYYHDSAAALLRGQEIVAAAQEERFTRIKHDPAFPSEAVQYVLSEAGIGVADLDCVVFYDKPILKFERLLETYLSYAPTGFKSFLTAMPVWLREKLFLKKLLRDELTALSDKETAKNIKLLFTEHHLSHAASAYYPSPFDSAAVVCLDGVGEWATTSVWTGKDNNLSAQWQIDFPHSLGLLYSAFTYYTGFKVNSGEYKVMGLAPYGNPVFAERIKNELMQIKDDGSFRLNMDYFNYAQGLTMTNSRFDDLMGAPRRKPESELSQREMDLAASVQQVTEEVVLKIANTVHQETGEKNLCLAGGVALNCVANGRLIKEGPFENVWIQPAAGDCGGALGAAYSAWHQYYGNERTLPPASDGMAGSYLGPVWKNDDTRRELDRLEAVYEELPDEELFDRVAGLLDEGNVIGWFQGRMEFGPRALGGRSILGDPRNETMQKKLNLKIKYRESFRPFAPSILADRLGEYFELDQPSPYMLVVAGVDGNRRIAETDENSELFGIDKLNVCRSDIPAVTHVDYSARIQTVHAETNPRYHKLLTAFEAKTKCPVLVNTSFNVRGEPIVCTPEDAFRCFTHTEMDYLAVGNFLLDKTGQTVRVDNKEYLDNFELD